MESHDTAGSHAGNGSPTRNGSPRRPSSPRAGNYPRNQAIAVAAVIVAVIIAFGAVVLVSNSHPKGTAKPTESTLVSPTGTLPGLAGSTNPLLAGPWRSVASDFARLMSSGEPPPDILGSLVIPNTAKGATYTNNDRLSGPYDRAVGYNVNGLFDSLVSFFRTELPSLGWRINSTSTPAHQAGKEILAMRPSSDGFYWEVGITISSTTAQGAVGTPVTHFVVRLLQVQGGA
ncbi:MAG: hypothetical protein ACRD0I_06380 [Acidimicrobiales bacterium]